MAAIAQSAGGYELVIPAIEYRTGPYAPDGIPLANGYADYYTMLNERDGGICLRQDNPRSSRSSSVKPSTTRRKGLSATRRPRASALRRTCLRATVDRDHLPDHSESGRPGSYDTALDDRPEALNRLCMNCANNGLLFGMVDKSKHERHLSPSNISRTHMRRISDDANCVLHREISNIRRRWGGRSDKGCGPA